MRIRHRKKDGSIVIKYYCLLENGKVETLTREEISERGDEIINNPLENVELQRKVKSGCGRKRDGFKPHKSFATGEWIETRGQLKRHAKKHGLDADAGDFKSGNEFIGEGRKNKKKSSYLTDETFKELQECGVEISENEVKELKDKEDKGNLDKDIFIESNNDKGGYTSGE